MIRRLLRMCALSAFCAAASQATPGLIISPSTGTMVFSPGADDASERRALDAPFTIFGATYDYIDISTNGNLNFEENINFENEPLPSTRLGAMIAPLWDDLAVLDESSIVEQVGAGWYAVTWNDIGAWRDPSHRHTFQALLFTQDVNLGGFEFHASDIAMAYGELGELNDDSATVGLNSPEGLRSAGLPGDGATIVTNDDLYRLPEDNRWFLLYRWNGEEYDVSYRRVSHPLPEPLSAAALALGALILAGRLGVRRRRR